MRDIQISIYNGVKDNTGTVTTTGEVLSTIGSDQLSIAIYNVTHELNDKNRATLKSKLPAVTWSGTFTKRKSDQLINYSGLICLDFDKLELKPLRDLKDKTKVLPFVFAAFTSPSGKGLKVVCMVAGGPEAHAENFRALADYFFTAFGVAADESGKDVCRLCFLSWDMGIFINEQCVPFATYTAPVNKTAAPLTKYESNRLIKNDTKQSIAEGGHFDILRDFTEKKAPYTENLYHKHLSTFVINCKEHGYYQQDVYTYCTLAYADYIEHHPAKSLENILNTVYNSARYTFGKYQNLPGEKREKTPITRTEKITAGQALKESAVKKLYNEDVKFWYEVEKEDPATKQMKIEVKFDHDKLTWFMHNNGFRKLKLGEKGFQYIRKTGNLLEALEPDELNGFMLQYLQQYVKSNESDLYDENDINDELRDVRRMYMRGINNYSKPTIYNSLQPLAPNFLRDTEKETYLYFNNGFVKITADAITLTPYEELNANIWQKQKKDFDIKILDRAEISESVAYKFIRLAIVGSAEGDDVDAKKLQSMLTTLGYNVDSYKDETEAKSTVFQDKRVNLSGAAANGRSGKTLVAKMIRFVTSVCLIDGKAFSFDRPYPYDVFRIDDKVIVYNDVSKKFPFEMLFHKITEDFQFDRRYVDAITIPYKDSPRHLIITNYSIGGDGDSYEGRQQIIEFSNYFNKNHTPKDEFGHRFFVDWDNAEWNRFFNFFFICIQEFKKHGLITFPAENVKLNKLIQAAGETFIDWMDDKYINAPGNSYVYGEATLERDIIFAKFLEECREYDKMKKSNTFTGWVKMWCEVRGYDFNKHKNGDKDKSGSTYYWTITKQTA